MFIQISAGELSEFCFPEGSLGVMPTLERMFEGTKAHKKLQKILVSLPWKYKGVQTVFFLIKKIGLYTKLNQPTVRSIQ